MTFETKVPGFRMRFAEAADAGLVLEFIQALADYEKLSHEVVATEADLRENLFGGRPNAEALIGYFEDTPVSFALFFHNFSTFLGRSGIYLEDLFVQPEYRGQGFGGAMLAYLAKLARERKCGRLEWSVLDWNEPAKGFYKRIGAVPMDEWTVNRLSGEALEKLAGDF